MRARQLGGEIQYLSQGEIEARNRGYSPYSVETWRTWEYRANKAGCGHLLTPPDGMRTCQKADPQNGRFPLGALLTLLYALTFAPLEPTARPRREAVPASEFRPGKKQASLSGVPMVRIHLPPADSLSLSRSSFRRSRTRLSARVWAAGLATGSAETCRVFRYRVNRRQYLCRAIFQYRGAAGRGAGLNAR